MDSSVSPKDEIWFMSVCHHISNAVYYCHQGLSLYFDAEFVIHKLILILSLLT